jgi:probable phosphomutase (TIGR03848 family)
VVVVVRRLAGVATVILLRHGRSTSNAAGVLAGRSDGVELDEHGQAQARTIAERLAPLRLAAVVSSPLQRCLQTLAPLTDSPTVDERLAEIDYGRWTGQELRKLVKEPMWKVVQQHPSAAVFPEGEAMADVSARAVAAVREWDRKVTETHGPSALWLACSHGDVIKAVLADALGLHLDGFQRIVVDPCSISVISYTSVRPFIIKINDGGADVGSLQPPKRRRRRKPSSTAVVGGSTGEN